MQSCHLPIPTSLLLYLYERALSSRKIGKRRHHLSAHSKVVLIRVYFPMEDGFYEMGVDDGESKFIL